MAHDVFISHSSKDKVIADAACAALESAQIRCWIAPRDIRSGENWAESINNAIKSSPIMVLIFSKNSNQSKQIANELTLAVNSETTVIPFKIDDILPCGVLEYYLAATHWLDAMNPPTKKQINTLVENIKSGLDVKQAEVAATQVESQEVTASIPEIKQQPKKETPVINKKTGLAVVAVLACALLVFGGYRLLFPVSEIKDEGSGMDEQKPEDAAEEPPQTDAPAVIAGLDADYHIDYENGTISIGDLPIGARVVDPSWEWEFRTGDNYWGSGKVTTVTWIVVAKDHYDGLEPHVTLLADELIGKHTFDNSTNRGTPFGSNHWGDSGTANASHGLRPWLNSTGIYSNGGFYRAFSESFKAAVLATTVPNKEWKNGTAYSTEDYVFLPSTTELGDTFHRYTYQIGMVYPYFEGSDNARRAARLNGEVGWYWTRSPASGIGYYLRSVNNAGDFYYSYGSANYDSYGVRPAMNLKSEILVSEIRN